MREYTPQLRKDLVSTFNRVLRSLGYRATTITRMELIRRTIYSPTERFYVSTEEATRQYRYYLANGKKIKDMPSKMRYQMYAEIFRRADQIRANTTISIKDAIESVVYSPAPQFYLTFGTVKVMLHLIQHDR